ncbi:MAG: hypothetical protein ACSW77_03880 [Bacteroidales bacterium]
MENYNEFDEMRQQINLLKSKLNDQKIVNDQMLRKVVQEKVDTIHKVGWRVVIFGILEIPFVIWVFRELCGFSWMFCIVTALYVLSSVIFQVIMNMSLQRQIRPNDDLLAVGKHLTKLKRLNVKQLYFYFPFTALWTGLLIWEAYKNPAMLGFDFTMFVCIVIFGVVLGLVIGLTIFFKRYNAMKDAISQIEMFLPEKSKIWQNQVNSAINTIDEFGK